MKFLALIGLIAILLTMNLANAATTTYKPPNPVCLDNESIAGYDIIPTDNSLNYLTLSGLLSISIILLTIMIMVSGVLWALSGLLELPMLKEYSRRELGQIVLTGVVVLIILGTFSTLNFAASKVIPFSKGVVTSAVYNHDCTSMFNSFTGTMGTIIYLVEYDDITKLVGSLSLYIEPGYFGYESEPYHGALLSGNLISLMITLTGGVAVLYLTIDVILTLIYVIMPLFLFVGIVLRCLPWTRAAGGAFIAMFIGFFIIFPILIGVFISEEPTVSTSSLVTPSSGILNPSTSIFNIGTIFSTMSSYITSIFDGYHAVSVVSSTIIGPALFIILGSLLSLIIAFDFTDTLGDLLGSPSLSSSGSFSKLV